MSMSESTNDTLRTTLARAAQGLPAADAGPVVRLFRHGSLEVESHAPHRFEDFTVDFATWVFFYDPEGGEAEAPS